MDLSKQQEFIAHLRDRGGAGTQVAVTLEQFFDGNDCEWCIAPNRDQDTDLSVVRDHLFALRERPEVHDVRVEVDTLEFATFPEDEWPFASGAAVVTTLLPPEIDMILADVEVSPSGGPAPSAEWLVDGPEVPPGHHYVGVWWA